MFSFCQLRRFSVSTVASAVKKVNSIAVLGSGFMGRGIAQTALQTGHRVKLVDLNQGLLDKALQGLTRGLNSTSFKKFPNDLDKAKAFSKESLANLTLLTDAKKAVTEDGGVDLVIETIPEVLVTKQKLLAELDRVAPDETIFTSNTSGFLISEVMRNVKRGKRVAGTHFFPPVPKMKLVEVIPSVDTSDETVQTLCSFCNALEKTTVVCKDTPLFIVNRFLVPFSIQALAMFERGDASIEDIDRAIVYGLGYIQGPFELCDTVGLDVYKFVTDAASKRFPDNPMFKPSPTINKLVAQGHLGRKTRRGFYIYDEKGHKIGPADI